MIDLTDDATARHLHSGCALLIGVIGADGQPWAARAWGLTIVDPEVGLLRVLIEADDHFTLALLRDGGRVAITATNVTTFESMQLKGRGVSIEEMTDADEAKRAQYTENFLQDIHTSDGYALDLMQRWAGARERFVPVIVQVDSSFDQTPGPSAGVATDRSTP